VPRGGHHPRRVPDPRRRIVARTLGAPISAAIVVGAVAVLFTVCLVVLPVVRDQIVQGEPGVTGDEVLKKTTAS
jgi:hypothetical protein